MLSRTILVPLIFLSPGLARSQEPPAMADTDRIRIAEAFRLADALGNRVWPDWDKVPFAVLLVTPSHEFLLRHAKPSGDFTLIGEDTLLKHKVWFRKRVFGTGLLATFPAVGGVPTIVIGQPENTTSKTSRRWVITLLHEHFHQLQNAQPRYFADVDALNLTGGDKTGMWMLNYPFPYTKPEVKDQFAAMTQALVAALAARGKPGFADKLDSYLDAKKKLKAMVSPDDYKYFSFQLWQEGIARHTELRMAELAADEYEPTKDFKNLKDYTSFKDAAQAILNEIENELASAQLDKAKRTAFYAVGAGEGLLLDSANPEWRTRYFEEKFSLDKHFRLRK